jgi:hypothetical protein
MPSIAEKIAARRAAAMNKPAPSPPPTAVELREQAELKASIDRIDPPGKHERAESARKTARLILKVDTNPETRVKPMEDRRALGAENGETLDMTPMDARQAEAAWHAAFNAFESELCMMRDPRDQERAWIAVRLLGQEDWPILLKSLPLYEHPRTVREGPF